MICVVRVNCPAVVAKWNRIAVNPFIPGQQQQQQRSPAATVLGGPDATRRAVIDATRGGSCVVTSRVGRDGTPDNLNGNSVQRPARPGPVTTSVRYCHADGLACVAGRRLMDLLNIRLMSGQRGLVNCSVDSHQTLYSAFAASFAPSCETNLI